MAVLMVFLSQTSGYDSPLFFFLDVSGSGKSGVFLFFVLSAFLLTYPFISKGSIATTKEFLLNYCLRRFFRIYPLYILYLLTALATIWLLAASQHRFVVPFSLTVSEFIDHIFLQAGKSITWSIPVEFSYYFV